MGNGLHIDSDGCIFIRETSGFQIACRETEEVQQILDDVITDAREAKAKSGRPQKHLIIDIAGIHEGVTLNATEYRIGDLRESIPSWTSPYGKPIITNHDEGDVNNIVGRIVAVTETVHNDRAALNFKAHITDPTAVEKIRDGLWQTVSQGVRVKSAVCSICGNDWAKGTWCEHDRGTYYVKSEDQESGKSTLCTWVLGGLSGKELSFVTVPADQDAMITAIDNGKTGQANSEAYVLTSGDLVAISESFGVKQSGHSGEEMAIIESLMTIIEAAEEPEDNVDPDNENVEGEETPEADAADEATAADEAPVEGEENTDAGEEDESEDAAGESADEDEDTSTDEADDEAGDAAGEDEATGDEAAGTEADAEATDDAGAGSDDDLPDHDEANEAEISRATDELHQALVSLYVERAMATGDLSGEREDLMSEYSERSLDEMRILVAEQTKLSRFNPRNLEQLRGVVEQQTTVAHTGDDAAANADHVSEKVVYKVKVGDEFVEFDDTEIERVTTVRLEPTVK